MAQSVINTVEENIEVNEEKKISEDKILEMLFEQIEKPKNYFRIRAINVYDNAYRVNIWCEYEENNLTKRKIGYSYFVKVYGNELVIK